MPRTVDGVKSRAPLALHDRPLLRLITLCALYLTQGLPYGFMFLTLSGVLAREGMSPGDIGDLLKYATLPWAFKWIAGPIIDGFGLPSMGRRRPWILLAQSGMVLSLVVLSFGPDPLTHHGFLATGLFCMSACSALQDVSVDALAVDMLRDSERGRANGFMYGSSYMGNALGGAGMGTIVAVGGLRVGFLVIALVVTFVMLLPLFIRERSSERLLPWTRGEASLQSPDVADSLVTAVMRLIRAFSLRSSIALALLTLTISISNGMLTGFSSVLIIQDLGWSVEKNATWGGFATWMGLIGSIGGGLLADRIGARRLAVMAGSMLAILTLIFADAQTLWRYDSFIIAHMFFDALLSGILYVSLFSLCMKVSWPLVAATQFTAYMAMMNFSRTIGQDLTGRIEDMVTISGAYALAAVLQAAPLLFLIFIDPDQTRRVLGDGESQTDTSG